jgi:serine phosphatase RsbU (regulator of sigma subunit)
VADAPLLIAAAHRSYPGESVSGDAWRADWHEGRYRIAVIDGLGHGPAAAAAAQAALAVLAADPALLPDAAIRQCHAALRPTRGAAMLVAQIEPEAGRLTIAGVGNVEARLQQNERSERVTTDRGIVGAVLPTLHPVVRPLVRPWLLLIHTDGVRNRFRADEAAAAGGGSVDEVAAAILARWARVTDDATVLVARSR